jgi:hypothetical protein
MLKLVVWISLAVDPHCLQGIDHFLGLGVVLHNRGGCILAFGVHTHIDLGDVRVR